VSITPSGEKYVGPEFTTLLKANIQTVKNYFAALKSEYIKFVDYSMLFDSSYFTHLNDTTEHLNYKGRETLAKLLINTITEKQTEISKN